MPHHHHNDGLQKNLIVSIILNFLISVIEFAAGIFSNSLALVSDALHNFGDMFSLLLSLVAVRMSKWKATPNKSYGYMRAEIIVAFINSIALVLIGIYIFYEATGKFFHPEPVAGKTIIIAASFAFLANIFSTFLLHKNSHENLNAKSAYLHLLFDSLNSILVVIAGVFILFFNWTILDPIFSLIIGIFIIKSGWDVVLDAVNILSEGTPKEINAEEVTKFIAAFPDVKEVHHVHIWSLSSKYFALSAHVVVDDQLLSKGYLITHRLEKALEEKFGIGHPTLQLEADLSKDQKDVLKIIN
ncbi:MAG: cation diffusion facilitator family transporter [Ignavibacteriaceae bacterium]